MSIRAATWPSGIRVVWRDLTWGEYREVVGLQTPPAEKALKVYQLCVKEGPRADEIPAGIMMWIFEHQIEDTPFSGQFNKISGPLETARSTVSGTYLLAAQAFIASVFKIPFETMDGWPAEKLLIRLAQAEFVSGVPLNPIDPKNPKAAGGKQKIKKKPLTEAQKIAIERRMNDQPNGKGPRTTGGRPSVKSAI